MIPNRYYVPDETRAERVQALFARIAQRYDLINDLMSWGMHRSWKRRLIRLARPRPGEHSLDLCCGTGDLVRTVAAETGESDGTVTLGLDFTNEMLRLARHLTPASASAGYLRGDALSLPFPDAHFDLVTCAYGLRNLADLDRGLREAHRVLRPGGRLASLEFGRPDNLPLRTAYFTYLRFLLPLYGLLFFGDPHTYGYICATVRRFPGSSELAQRMEKASFQRVETYNLMGGVMGICLAWKQSSGTEGRES